MKKYIATFWMFDPQLSRGGYITITREIKAKSLKAAEKKANSIAKRTLCGSMILQKIEESKDN